MVSEWDLDVNGNGCLADWGRIESWKMGFAFSRERAMRLMCYIA